MKRCPHHAVTGALRESPCWLRTLYQDLPRSSSGPSLPEPHSTPSSIGLVSVGSQRAPAPVIGMTQQVVWAHDGPACGGFDLPPRVARDAMRPAVATALPITPNLAGPLRVVRDRQFTRHRARPRNQAVVRVLGERGWQIIGTIDVWMASAHESICLARVEDPPPPLVGDALPLVSSSPCRASDKRQRRYTRPDTIPT